MVVHHRRSTVFECSLLLGQGFISDAAWTFVSCPTGAGRGPSQETTPSRDVGLRLRPPSDAVRPCGLPFATQDNHQLGRPAAVTIPMRSKSASGLFGLGILLRTDPLVLALTGTSGDLPGTSGTLTDRLPSSHFWRWVRCCGVCGKPGHNARTCQEVAKAFDSAASDVIIVGS